MYRTKFAAHRRCEFYAPRGWSNPVVYLRYACDAGDGRTLDVQWNGTVYNYAHCTNTGGWGESNSDFSWVSMAPPMPGAIAS